MIAVWFDQFAAGGQPGEVFEQQATIAATTQSHFADQLLVAGTLAGCALDAPEQVTVVV